LEPVISHPSF